MTKKDPQILHKIENSQSDFVGNLGNYRFVETEDNSLTLWSSFFDETFHNTSGALQETFYTYLESTQVKRCLSSTKESPFAILEVGFGMGLGFFALDQYLKFLLTQTKTSAISLNFVSFEIDHEMLEHLINLNTNSPEILPAVSEWKKYSDHYVIQKEVEFNQCKISFTGILLIGDGRKVLSHQNYLNQHCPFSAIFQDPFSPKKNPDLWTVEWFLELKKLSKEDAILSTYSSSTVIRKSLLEAKWLVHNQKGFGHKKAMTIASLQESLLGKSDPEILKKLTLSQNKPIFDCDLESFLEKRASSYQR